MELLSFSLSLSRLETLSTIRAGLCRDDDKSQQDESKERNCGTHFEPLSPFLKPSSSPLLCSVKPRCIFFCFFFFFFVLRLWSLNWCYPDNRLYQQEGLVIGQEEEEEEEDASGVALQVEIQFVPLCFLLRPGVVLLLFDTKCSIFHRLRSYHIANAVRPHCTSFSYCSKCHKLKAAARNGTR